MSDILHATYTHSINHQYSTYTLPIITTISLAVVIVCIAYYFHDYTDRIRKTTPTVATRRLQQQHQSASTSRPYDRSPARQSGSRKQAAAAAAEPSWVDYDMQTSGNDAYFNRSSDNDEHNPHYDSASADQEIVGKITQKLNRMQKLRGTEGKDGKVGSKPGAMPIDYANATKSIVQEMRLAGDPGQTVEHINGLHALIQQCTTNSDFSNRTIVVNALVDNHGLDVLQKMSDTDGQHDTAVQKAAESLLQTVLPLIW